MAPPGFKDDVRMEEVYTQHLKRVHAYNWKTNRGRDDSQSQQASFFKYSPVIKAFLAGLTCDVLRARLRQAADKRSLTLIGFLEVHHDNVTKAIQSTNGPLFLVYPKHDILPDLSQWNSRLICTILVASNCLDADEYDDVIYLRNLTKRYFHDNKNDVTGNSTKRREWIQLFKIVQRLVENVNDVNLIRQVRNFICKIEMEACKLRTRKETQVRLESLISDMIADRIQPQHKKTQLTDEAIQEFRRQLINLSHINMCTPNMFPKMLRPQSARASASALKTTGQHETNVLANTNRRPSKAGVRRRKSVTIKKPTTNVKCRPASAHAISQNSRGKGDSKREQRKRPSSAYVAAEKLNKPIHEETKDHGDISSVSRKPTETESDSLHKDYSYIGPGRNKHRVIIMYKERLKDDTGNARISSPPVVKDTKVAEPNSKAQADPEDKSDKKIQENGDTPAIANITEANTCACKQTETTRKDWGDNLKNITNEVLVHQQFHKAVTNPLLSNKDFVDDFITYLKQNHALKQFLRARSTDSKQCFKVPHGRSVQLSFFLAFLSRHIEPKLMESAVYIVQKLLHHMKCKDTQQTNTNNVRSSSNCLTGNQKYVTDGNTERVVGNTDVPKRGLVKHTESDLKTSHTPNKAKSNSTYKKTASNHTRSQLKEEQTRHTNTNIHSKIRNRRGFKNDKTNRQSDKQSSVTRSPHPRRSRSRDSTARSRSGSTDRRQKEEHETTKGDNDKEKATQSKSTHNTCCWRCSQKEDAMSICINWGNTRMCDLLLAEGVPYRENHLVAAVNANDLDALTAIVSYLRRNQSWNPEGHKAGLALKLAAKYRMQAICVFLKKEGVSLNERENSPFSEKGTCSSCFIT